MTDINPYLALTIFLIISFLVGIAFWPRIGLIYRIKKTISHTKRVLMEDALKHIYDYEIHQLSPTLNSIAGNLGISTDKSSKIVENLKKLNLVSLSDRALSLTEGGREYALRIIRVHRLWESYLAEETGVTEIDWHDEAERVEHYLSEEDADQLSAKISNPKFDPHGDPIPNSDGNVIQDKSILLNTVENGEIVKIIHIEDEPKSIYTNLLDEGLFPGKEIKIINRSEDQIKIAYDGYEKELTLLAASKLSVIIVPREDFKNQKVRTLADLKAGETAEVVNVAPNCRGHQRRRLLDFGIVPGSKIAIHINSPLNDPKAYVVKDTIVALRKNQANKVIINN
ncbi:MAG: metal-dependent transcriptional regulator [Melioribacteraceae bacterium]|nr:metal-dependent transcriptional regulator [Melioribacteraceae bacterium]